MGSHIPLQGIFQIQTEAVFPALQVASLPLAPLGKSLCSDSKESSWNARDLGSIDSWVRNILWIREWLATPVFMSGEFHGQGSLATVLGVAKSRNDCDEHFQSLLALYANMNKM